MFVSFITSIRIQRFIVKQYIMMVVLILSAFKAVNKTQDKCCTLGNMIIRFVDWADGESNTSLFRYL